MTKINAFSNKKIKYFYYVVFVLAFFILANNTYINGGYCSWSTCHSVEFRSDGEIYDLFISSHTIVPVAPSILLFQAFVNHNPNYQLLHYDDSVSRDYFDYNDNSAYKENRFTELQPYERGLAWWFIAIKGIVLMSLPLWLLCAYILRYVTEFIFRSRAQTALVVIAVFALLFSIKVHLLTDTFYNNYQSVTWPILLHQNCCNLRWPG